MNNFNVSDVMIRNTIQTYEKSQNFNNYKEFIEIIKNDNIFLEQILLANPKLYGMLKKYNAGKLKKKKKIFLNQYINIIKGAIIEQLLLDYLVKLLMVNLPLRVIRKN